MTPSLLLFALGDDRPHSGINLCYRKTFQHVERRFTAAEQRQQQPSSTELRLNKLISELATKTLFADAHFLHTSMLCMDFSSSSPFAVDYFEASQPSPFSHFFSFFFRHLEHIHTIHLPCYFWLSFFPIKSAFFSSPLRLCSTSTCTNAKGLRIAFPFFRASLALRIELFSPFYLIRKRKKSEQSKSSRRELNFSFPPVTHDKLKAQR